MDVNTLMQLAGLTQEEQQDLSNYLQENQLSDLIGYAAQNLSHITNVEKQQFECYDLKLVQLNDQQLDEEINELNKLAEISVLNSHQVQLTTYFEQIVEDMHNVKQIDVQNVFTQFPEEPGVFQSKLQQFASTFEQLHLKLAEVVKNYYSNKSNLTAFQPSLAYNMDKQLDIINNVIKNEQLQFNDNDVKQKYMYGFQEAQRLQNQYHELNIQNIQLNQLIQLNTNKPNYYNNQQQSIQQSLQIEDNTLQNELNRLQQLQNDNIQLNIQYDTLLLNKLDENIVRELTNIFTNIKDDLQQFNGKFTQIYQFVQKLAEQVDQIIDQLSQEQNVVHQIIDLTNTLYSNMTDICQTIQQIILNFLSNNEKLAHIQQNPLQVTGIAKVMEQISNTEITNINNCNDAYEELIERQVISNNQQQAMNKQNNVMFFKKQLVEQYQNLGQLDSNSKLNECVIAVQNASQKINIQ